MDIFGIFTMIGGLALFLYGMSVMGDSLSKLSGGKLESILERLTSTKVRAILLGALVTAVIQSSSATTVMVVGFVNSGIMQLSQSVGIIMGANIGTTITSWLLSLTGLSGENVFIKLLKPSSFSNLLMKLAILTVRDKGNVEGDSIRELPAELKALDERFLDKPAYAMELCWNAACAMAKETNACIHLALDQLREYNEDNAEYIKSSEDLLDTYEDILGTYLVKLSGRDLSHADSQTLSIMLTSNRGLLIELIDNLVQNAIRYNHPNGKVDVYVGKEGNQSVLMVSDTGIGIPKEDMERVFERFYRVDKSRSRETGGTGLGLAIVKHIVELHDGRIELESEPGKGTSIKILI